MRIRPEDPGDAAAVAALNRDAFGGEDEVALIERLRADRLVAVSLVADEGASLVGHILFSDLAVELDGRPVRAAALAPMCVRGDRQRHGIGSALVRAGLAAVREAGYAAVIVLGHRLIIRAPAFQPGSRRNWPHHSRVTPSWLWNSPRTPSPAPAAP